MHSWFWYNHREMPNLDLYLSPHRLCVTKEKIMTTDIPRPPDEWNDLDDTALAGLSAVQFIAYTHHHLRQKASVAVGLGQMLADGALGFSSTEQQAALVNLQRHLEAIQDIRRWMTRWLFTRVDKNGNWISDAQGSLPSPERDNS
jgi:hypothetical protein